MSSAQCRLVDVKPKGALDSCWPFDADSQQPPDAQPTVGAVAQGSCSQANNQAKNSPPHSVRRYAADNSSTSPGNIPLVDAVHFGRRYSDRNDGFREADSKGSGGHLRRVPWQAVLSRNSKLARFSSCTMFISGVGCELVVTT